MILDFEQLRSATIPNLNGGEGAVTAGLCHYCPKGSSHSILNTGVEELVLLTVVPEL